MNSSPRPLLSLTLALLVSLLCLAAGCQNDPAPPNADPSATAEPPTPVVAPSPRSPVAAPPRSPVPAPPAAPAAPPIPNPATTPGQGSPTEFQGNRPAVMHFGGQKLAIPGTIWLAAAYAPDGETPFSFRSNSEGLYLFTFRDRTPCNFTDAAGRPLPLVGATLSLDPDANGAARTIFKLQFSGK